MMSSGGDLIYRGKLAIVFDLHGCQGAVAHVEHPRSNVVEHLNPSTHLLGVQHMLQRRRCVELAQRSQQDVHPLRWHARHRGGGGSDVGLQLRHHNDGFEVMRDWGRRRSCTSVVALSASAPSARRPSFLAPRSPKSPHPPPVAAAGPLGNIAGKFSVAPISGGERQ